MRGSFMLQMMLCNVLSSMPYHAMLWIFLVHVIHIDVCIIVCTRTCLLIVPWSRCSCLFSWGSSPWESARGTLDMEWRIYTRTHIQALQMMKSRRSLDSFGHYHFFLHRGSVPPNLPFSGSKFSHLFSPEQSRKQEKQGMTWFAEDLYWLAEVSLLHHQWGLWELGRAIQVPH